MNKIACFLIFIVVNIAYVHADSVSTKVDMLKNGNLSVFEYTLNKTPRAYSAQVKVTSADGKILLDHQYVMEESDLNQMMEEEERPTVAEWVSGFFNNESFGGRTFSWNKLKKEDLNPEYIKYAADGMKIKSADLQKEILNQKLNFQFVYRAAWREELYVLVFVPGYNKFVAYTGYGD